VPRSSDRPDRVRSDYPEGIGPSEPRVAPVRRGYPGLNSQKPSLVRGRSGGPPPPERGKTLGSNTYGVTWVMLGQTAQPSLTFTKFAPARPDRVIKWPGAQIWNGPGRTENTLVADCIDENWAKSLSTSYNEVQALNTKLAAANVLIRDLLIAVTDSAKECKSTDQAVSESLTETVTTFKAQAKKAGLNPN